MQKSTSKAQLDKLIVRVSLGALNLSVILGLDLKFSVRMGLDLELSLTYIGFRLEFLEPGILNLSVILGLNLKLSVNLILGLNFWILQP